MDKNMSQEKNELYYSDDYAGCSNEKHQFYYGYEATFCPLHGKDSDCECEDNDWCFTVDVDGKEVLRLTTTELYESIGRMSPNEGMPEDYLLIGIMEYMRRNIK